jgi:DNA-binding MarR family transcriptional regulator
MALTLTAEGEALLAALHAAAQAHVDRVRAHLGPDRYDALLGPLQQLATIMRP